jgi:hypothetical protein
MGLPTSWFLGNWTLDPHLKWASQGHTSLLLWKANLFKGFFFGEGHFLALIFQYQGCFLKQSFKGEMHIGLSNLRPDYDKLAHHQSPAYDQTLIHIFFICALF